MGDLTLHEYREASGESLRRILRDEAAKICGAGIDRVPAVAEVRELRRFSIGLRFWNRVRTVISTVQVY